MLYACLCTICFVFCYTSWRFYAFSGTNLLTRCLLVFCCFCVSEKLHRKYSRNWTKRSPNLLFFPDVGRRPKESWSWARDPPHQGVARVDPWACHPMVWRPWSTSDTALPPISSLRRENPKSVGNFSEEVSQLRRRHQRDSGDGERIGFVNQTRTLMLLFHYNKAGRI
jgi:hypothetical protein